MVTALSWVLGSILVVAFASAGYAKVTEQPVMTKAARHLGLSPEAYRIIGAAELAGAIGVLLGLIDSFIWVGFLAGFGLIGLMFGAIFHHLRIDDHLSEAVPAAVMAVLAFGYVATLAG